MKENATNLRALCARLLLLLALAACLLYVLFPRHAQAVDCYAYAQQYYDNCVTYGYSRGFDCAAGDTSCCYHEYVQELEGCLYP